MSAIVTRYASAFLDVVTYAKLDVAAIGHELNDFLATWEGSAELRAFFSNPAVAAKQKIAFLDTLNKKLKLKKELRNLLAVLIDNNRIDSVAEVAATYRALLQKRLGIEQAEIATARALSDAEQATLIAEIGKAFGAKIEASFKLDTTILGGAVVRIGSTVYDGSVRGRLERLKEVLSQ